MVVSFAIVLVLVSVLVLVQFFLSIGSTLDDSQLTPLESGFESNLSSKVLSSSFFFLAILFVLFDMELILVFPSVVLCLMMSTSAMKSFMALVLIILITLLLEWSWCGLKWQV